MQRIPYLIVGAGVSGLAAARQLPVEQTQLIEKSRGPGGRLASKRLDTLRADIGAQFFTVRDRQFKTVVDAAVEAGAAARWTPRMGTIREGQCLESPDTQARYVGTPYMNAFGRFLATDLNTTHSLRVATIQRDGDHYEVHCEDGSTLKAEHVLVTAPLDQMSSLLADFAIDAISTRFAMAPTLTVVIESDQLGLETAGNPVDACFGGDDPVIDFVSFDGAKPGRDHALWVIHSTPEWIEPRLEEPPSVTGEALHTYAEQRLGLSGRLVHAHRWRYARPMDSKVTTQKGIYQVDTGLWIAGDYLAGGRVEGAYLAGLEAGQRLLSNAS